MLSLSVALLLFIFSPSLAAFTEDPQNATTLLGDQAIFTCSFENINSFPSWVGTDGETYTPSDVDGDVRYIPVSNMTISLNVTATLVRDGVCYRCDANLINNPTRSAQGCLTVVGPPDAPVVNQTDATLTTVTVSWSVPSSNPLYPVTGYEVMFNGTVTMLASSDTSYTITNLTSATMYAVEVRARNGDGPDNIGDPGTVMANTLSPMVPPAPVNVKSMVTFSSEDPDLQILWEAPILSAGQPPVTNYTIQYTLYGSNQTITVSGISPDTFNFTIANVSAEERYSVYVFAVNSAGSSPAASLEATVTYLQRLSVEVSGSEAMFSSYFAFGPDFNILSCSFMLDNMPMRFVNVADGAPPSATYTATNLAQGSHSVTAQAVRRSNRTPVEVFTIERQFTVEVDGSNDASVIGASITQLLGVLAVVLLLVVV